MHYWQNVMDGTWGVVMVSGMLGFWALAAAVIIWTLRPARHSTAILARAQQSGDAEGIPAGRLARGEIDLDKYRTTLTVLRSRSSS